jgi:hypothetical protein
MRTLISVLLLLSVWSAIGQSFNKRYDFHEQGRAQSALGIEQSLGSYLIIQLTSETDTLESGTYFSHPSVGVTRIDAVTGEKSWDRSFHPEGHGAGAGWANGTDSMPGGGVVVGGSKQDTLQNLSALLMVFDAQGDTVFTRDISPPGSQWNGFSVKHTLDGGFIVVGQTDLTGYLDGFAIKTDALGNVEWRRTYGLPAPRTDGFVSVVQLENGDYVFGGTKYPTDVTRQRWLLRTDQLGEPIWEVFGPTTTLAGATHVGLLENGDLLLASNRPYAPDHVQDRYYLAVVDPLNGSLIWEREYDQMARLQQFYAAKEASNGDLIACGVSDRIGYQGVLLRTNSEGDSLWMRKYVYQDDVIQDGAGFFFDVLPTPDGGFITTGTVLGRLNAPNPPGYSQDAWVVKVDGDGCIVPGCNTVGISEQVTNLQDAITVFPNPVAQGGTVTVQLDLPQHVQGKNLQLSVVGGDGRLVSSEGTNGASTLNLTNLQLAIGMYFLHLTNGTTWLTGAKLVVE